MKRPLICVLALTFFASCASRTSSQASAPANLNRNARPTAESAKPTPPADGLDVSSQVEKEVEKEKEAPPEFAKVDFKNFSYPTNLRRRDLRLRDGAYEYQTPGELGGDTFNYRDVDYADVTGDGKKEAFVQLTRVSCGASCDGGSILFYVYSARRHKPVLLWRIESGSLAYECGLKSFILDGRTVTFEVFRKCSFAGNSVRNGKQEGLGKFDAKFFTRFVFKFNGKTFALKGKKVFPFSGEVSNYSPTISISDD